MPGARGLIVPASTQIGNPVENQLLPATVEELKQLGLLPKEVALDGGFTVTATREQLEDLGPERVFISGRQQPGSRRTQRRLQRYRTGAEGRISHLKRGYGLRRTSRTRRRPCMLSLPTGCGRTRRRRRWPRACGSAGEDRDMRAARAAARALADDLEPFTGSPLWAARIDVVIRDDGREVYRHSPPGPARRCRRWRPPGAGP